MTQLLAYLAVFVTAAIPWLEVLLVVPAGLLAGLAPVPTVLIASAGNIVTLVPVVLAGDRLHGWLSRRRAEGGAQAPPTAAGDPGQGTRREVDEWHEGSSGLQRGAQEQRGDGQPGREEQPGDEQAGRRGQRARRLMNRYGLPGLAVLGPVLTGAHVAALVASASGSDRRRVLWWLSSGVVIWAVIAAVLTILGVEVLVDRDALPDLGVEVLDERDALPDPSAP